MVYDDAVFVPENMPEGDYELAVAILDPQSRKPNIRFAIAGRADYHSGGKVAANNAKGVGSGRRGDGSDGRGIFSPRNDVS